MKWPLVWLAVQFPLFGGSPVPNEARGSQASQVLHCLGGHLEALIFSPDSRWVAAAYFDLQKRVRLVGVWNADTLQPVFVDREKAGGKGIEALTFSPDCKQLLALSDSQDRNEWIVWDTKSGKRIKEQARPRERHDPHLLSLGQTRELLWVGGGRCLLHDTKAGLVTDLATGEVIHDYDKKFRDREPGVFGDGGIVISGGKDVARIVHDAITGQLLNTHPPINGCGYVVFDFSRGGVTRSAFTAEGLVLSRRDPPRKRILDFAFKSRVPDGAKLSPDGRWLAISYQYRPGAKEPVPAVFPGEYEYQQIFDAETGRSVRDAIGGMAVYFSPDGKRMAVVSRDDHIAILAAPVATR